MRDDQDASQREESGVGNALRREVDLSDRLREAAPARGERRFLQEGQHGAGQRPQERGQEEDRGDPRNGLSESTMKAVRFVAVIGWHVARSSGAAVAV